MSAACGEDLGDGPSNGDNPPTDSTWTLTVEEIASGLSDPVHLTAPAGDPRLFVVEQPGRIRILESGTLVTQPFLDIDANVWSGGERGLLSVAFHPNYASNGYFYVNYTTEPDGATRVERYTVSGDPDVADAASAKLILAVSQPYSNHNGGLIVFGPDGMLYIGMGDGGSGGDPDGNGQNVETLLGALLRIDVDAGDPYAIPPDNPFVSDPDPDVQRQIWAFGLRNPWRFAFDATDAVLYIADVGQNAWEEINAVPAAEAPHNYGWDIMEGAHCFGQSTCDETGLTLPVLEYGREGGACSVIGGYVYRGSAIPELQGHYFYSDFCAGFLRTFKLEDGTAEVRTEWPIDDLGAILSLGQDADGELYMLAQSGRVYKVIRIAQ